MIEQNSELPCDDCVELALACNDTLGEGPHWIPHTRTLLWVDIVDPALHFCSLDPAGRLDADSHQRHALDSLTGVVVPAGQGGFVAAGISGIQRLDEQLNASLLGDPESALSDNRFNDGKCDSRGRLWAGSLSMTGAEAQGGLWRIDPDGTMTRMIDRIDVGNGLGWNADESLMYYTDSGKSTIYEIEFDRDSGELGERRNLVTPESCDLGVPDGLAIDDEGFLWSARWDGACVIRHAPDGSIDRIVHLPVHRPTSCAFGGVDGSTLFVTSARVGLSESRLAQAPLSGSVFAIDAGVRGQAGHVFGSTDPA